MNAWFAGGVLAGILAVAIYGVLKKRRESAPRYDERQAQARANAAKLALEALAALMLVNGFVREAWQFAWAGPFLEAVVLLLIAGTVYVLRCVWTDAYFALREKPKTWGRIFVAMLVVNVALGVGSAGLVSWHHGGMVSISYGVMSGIVSTAILVALVLLYALAMVFTWIGWMRMSVYGRLSAGFQFERIWTMLRHDTRGAGRILGMYLLINAIIGVVAAVVVIGFVIGGMVFGVVVASAGADSGTPGFAVGLLVLAMVVFAALSYAGMVASVFCTTMVVRAMGYWTRQFDVPRWRGQDDPMPFETGFSAV